MCKCIFNMFSFSCKCGPYLFIIKEKYIKYSKLSQLKQSVGKSSAIASRFCKVDKPLSPTEMLRLFTKNGNLHKKLETIGMVKANNAVHLELSQLFARSLFINRKMQTKSVCLKKRTPVISQSILNELYTCKNKLWCFRKPHEF